MNKRNEVSTLIDEQEVAGYKVRPLSLDALEKLSPEIKRISNAVKAQGLSLESFEKNPIESIGKLFETVLPDMKKVIAISIEKEEKEIGKLPIDKAVQLALAVLTLNMSILKNLFGPMMIDLIRTVASFGPSKALSSTGTQKRT